MYDSLEYALPFRLRSEYLPPVGLGCCGKDLVMQETLGTLSLKPKHTKKQ